MALSQSVSQSVTQLLSDKGTYRAVRGQLKSSIPVRRLHFEVGAVGCVVLKPLSANANILYMQIRTDA